MINTSKDRWRPSCERPGDDLLFSDFGMEALMTMWNCGALLTREEQVDLIQSLVDSGRASYGAVYDELVARGYVSER